MKKLIPLFFAVVFHSALFAGGDSTEVYEIFKATRIGNGHSTETLWKNEVDLFFGHKFGDFSVGLENMWYTTDVSFGADVGISNNLNIGAAIGKGAGPYSGLASGFFKYKLFRQNTYDMPVSLAFVGTGSYSSMDASTDLTSPVAFQEWQHRLAYSFQALVSRKFSDRLSLQFMPTMVHRNLVAFEDENTMFALGGAAKFQVTKMFGITAEYFYLLNHNRVVLGTEYVDPLSIGFEFDTGGHVFRLILSNVTGFGETQYLPYTSSKWSDGGFRIGFCIGRVFKI